MKKLVSGKMSSNLEWFKNEVLEFLDACNKVSKQMLFSNEAVFFSVYNEEAKEIAYEMFDVLSFLVNPKAGITLEQAKSIIDINVWKMLQSAAAFYVDVEHSSYLLNRYKEWEAKKEVKYGVAEWRENAFLAVKRLATCNLSEGSCILFIEFLHDKYIESRGCFYKIES